MKQVWRRWSLRMAAAALLGGLALLAYGWTHRVWSLDEWLAYQAMVQECHPAWREFHFERIRAGDPAEDVIARTDPVRVERRGRWVILNYQEGLHFTGLTAAAYDGKMVYASAWSCTWECRFFDTMSENQRAECFSGGH